MTDTHLSPIDALRQRVQAFVDVEVMPRGNQDLWPHPGRLDEVSSASIAKRVLSEAIRP